MLNIIQAPNPVLSSRAKPVAKVDKAVLSLIEQMEQALNAASDPVGVGLAGPQVGKGLKLFIIKPTSKSPISVFINPKITLKTPLLPANEENEKPYKLEGCLSLKDIWGEVQRSPEIVLEYLDETGKPHKRKLVVLWPPLSSMSMTI